MRSHQSTEVVGIAVKHREGQQLLPTFPVVVHALQPDLTAELPAWRIMVGHQPDEKVARHLKVVFLDGARDDEQLDVVGPRAPYAPSASTSTRRMMHIADAGGAIRVRYP